MNQSLSLFVGLRYLGFRRRNQMASFLSILSIIGLCLGVALMVAVLSIVNGFDKELKEKILGLVPQASIHHRLGINDWQSLLPKIESQSNVEAAAPYIQLNGLINFRKTTDTVTIYGVEPDLERRVSLIDNYLDKEVVNQLSKNKTSVILGAGVASKLGVSVGGRVLLIAPNEKMRKPSTLVYVDVVGILRSRTELDSQLVIVSLDQAAKLSGKVSISGIRVKVGNIFDAPSAVREIVQDLEVGYYSNNWTRTHGNLYQAIQMSKNMIGLLVSLIIAIAAFNIVSTLVMVVIDKEGDIAILRTMGATTRDIVRIFLVFGTSIGFLGVFLGVLLGCILAISAENILQWFEMLVDFQFLKSDVYPLTYLPAHIQMSDIGYVSVTALFMCFIASLYPAWRASRIKPAVALRYE